jgi:hypothetical protein
MGTALINAYKLLHSCRTPSGALLLVSRSDVTLLPKGVSCREDGDIALVDWVHASYERLDRLLKEAALPAPSYAVMEQALERYMAVNAPPPDWVANTRRHLNLGT